jgi:hypothetical protein
MTDVKLSNGDIEVDCAGAAVMLSESEARLQSVLIRLTAQKGGFIYDRSLGCEDIANASPSQTEMLFNEAAADSSCGYIRYIGGENNSVAVNIDGTDYQAEVRYYGELH